MIAMNFILYFSEIMIPLTAACIILYGIMSHLNVFDLFLKGAASGIHTTFELLPTLIGLLIATSVLRDSGLLDFLCHLIKDFLLNFHISEIPIELLPLGIMKLFSASAANGLLFDIFKEYGTDSFSGMAASIMMSCSETMLYCISIYFGCIKITKTRWTIPGCLLSILCGTFVSILLAYISCEPLT